MEKDHLPDLASVEHQFMQRMAKAVVSRGKKVMCWDGIAQTGFGLPPDQVVPIWWHDEDLQGLSNKIAKGYQVVMCPHYPTYFEFIQSPELHSGRDFGKGRVGSTAAVYAYPDNLRAAVPNLDQAAGLQAAAWTEQIHSPERLWFMTFPRLTALAESAWTPAAQKDYADFSRRLPAHFAYLKLRGFNFYNPLDPLSTPEVSGPANAVTIDDGWGKTKSGKD